MVKKMSGKLSFTLAEYKVNKDEDETWVTTAIGVQRNGDFVGAVSCRVGNSSSSHGTGTGQILQWADGEDGMKFCDFGINDEFVEGDEINITISTS